MKVQTTRFGTIEVPEDRVVTMVDGMLGFSSCSRYTLMADEIGEPFQWFQSLDIPSLAFVVIDPALILPNYHFSVRRDQIKQLEVETVEDLQVWVLVTMSGNILDVTVNLQGPIVVNKKTRVGQQLVLNDPNCSTPHTKFGFGDAGPGATIAR